MNVARAELASRAHEVHRDGATEHRLGAERLLGHVRDRPLHARSLARAEREQRPQRRHLDREAHHEPSRVGRQLLLEFAEGAPHVGQIGEEMDRLGSRERRAGGLGSEHPQRELEPHVEHVRLSRAERSRETEHLLRRRDPPVVADRDADVVMRRRGHAADVLDRDARQHDLLLGLVDPVVVVVGVDEPAEPQVVSRWVARDRSVVARAHGRVLVQHLDRERSVAPVFAVGDHGVAVAAIAPVGARAAARVRVPRRACLRVSVGVAIGLGLGPRIRASAASAGSSSAACAVDALFAAFAAPHVVGEQHQEVRVFIGGAHDDLAAVAAARAVRPVAAVAAVAAGSAVAAGRVARRIGSLAPARAWSAVASRASVAAASTTCDEHDLSGSDEVDLGIDALVGPCAARVSMEGRDRLASRVARENDADASAGRAAFRVPCILAASAVRSGRRARVTVGAVDTIGAAPPRDIYFR